ncbi:MAG: DUF3892 domain-containing protein [Lachnospirales bacterium]
MNQNTNNQQNQGTTYQASNTFTQIPTPKANASDIVAVQKSGSQVTGYQLSNGQVVDKQQAISMAKSGDIKGVGVATNQGTEYLRSLPDNTTSNNLDSLPTIS